MSLENKFDQILKNFEDIESKLSEGISDPKKFAKYSKEFSELSPIAEKIKQVFKHKNELADLESLIKSDDQEIKEMAKIEKESLIVVIPELEKELKFLLIPKDEADKKNAIIEIRAGTGGEEAALFAADLFRMYNRYAEIHNWKSEIMDISETDHDGLKEIIINVSGKNVFGRLKFESGTHRVQRVPETESGGRIHTSAATVAVLPEATDIDIEINEKDLRIDIFRSSGPGGQSVNTTDSAVRITHLPTGVISQCQDEKSQHKNKAKALIVLRSRIYESERMKKDKERAQDRKSQVGSGDRSERIRTYNYPQGRVTDHRISLTLYKLDQILKGESLDEVIDALRSEEKAKKLSSINQV